MIDQIRQEDQRIYEEHKTIISRILKNESEKPEKYEDKLIERLLLSHSLEKLYDEKEEKIFENI